MAKRQNPKPFSPVKGEIYENAGGGRYLCESDGNEHSARMMNVTSGWTFIAKGIVRYDDGTIEWDYSVDGTFVPLDRERQERIFRATFRHKQNSIVNALLCCMI